ncbi:MAG: hypothetical protein KDG89_13270 [Geminicoccaceae bacterium]|nr:hypothetical protein [Geminicoccaceae bacterium]
MTWTWFAAQIEAALRLLRREPDAITGFDLSVDGFWRSFVAALVCLPGFFLLSPPNDPGFSWPSETLGYVVGWLVFPLVMVPLSRSLGKGERYVPLVVAINWGAVLQMAAFVTAVTLSRLLPQPLGALLVLGTTVVVVLYEWHIVRSALATTAGIAAALTALDLGLGIAVERAFSG